jgi:hypothetical protein
MILVRFAVFFAVTLFIGQYLTRIQGPTMVYWAVTLPGTFFHELAHYTAALFTQGNPTGLSIWPTWDANGNMATMGHVYVHDNWYNAAFTSLAPLLLAPITVLFVARAAVAKGFIKPFLYAYFAACAWASCIPSPQDFSLAMVPSSWPFAAFALGLTTYAVYRVTRYTLKV